VLIKESSEAFWYDYWLMLIRIDWWIKNLISCIYSACNNDYVGDFWDLNSLVDTISNSKQFSFHRSDTNYMMYHFIDRIWEWMDVHDWHNNVVLDDSIWNYSNRIGIGQGVKNFFIKFVNISSLTFFVSVICSVK